MIARQIIKVTINNYWWANSNYPGDFIGSTINRTWELGGKLYDARKKVIDLKVFPLPNNLIRSLETLENFVTSFAINEPVFWATPTWTVGKFHFFSEWSREENEGTNLCSTFNLVGVEIKIKFLSHQVNEIIE